MNPQSNILLPPQVPFISQTSGSEIKEQKSGMV